MSQLFNDDQYPGTATVYIEATWGTRISTGSGAIVGRNDILTAAHVVYDASLRRYADRIDIYPSYNPNRQDNIRYSAVFVNSFTSFDPDGDGFLSPAGAQDDIAIVSLASNVQFRFGSYGLDPGFRGGFAEILGYPGVYGRNLINDRGWISENPEYWTWLTTNLEINPGNSGGPIFYYGEGSVPYLVGVVSTDINAADIYRNIDWIRQTIAGNDSRIVADTPTAQSDVLALTPRSDSFSALAGNDLVFADDGDDTIAGGPGNDTINGGAGTDTARFSGSRGQYTISQNAQSVTVADRVANRDGTDLLQDVEVGRFSDGGLVFGLNANGAIALRLYQSALGRLPDAAGLIVQANALSTGYSLPQIAAGFVASAEFIGRYGTLDNAGFVGRLYANVLGRSPDSAGLSAWLGFLQAGNTRADALVGFSESAENQQLTLTATLNGLWVV